MSALTEKVAALVARQRAQQTDADRQALQTAYRHQPEPLEAEFSQLACDHPDRCSCPGDYPGWMPGGPRVTASSREVRLAQLLDTIRTHPGRRWTASGVQDWRRLIGGPTQRSTARRDLAELARRGHLIQHGPDDGRFYTLKTRKDGRS
ncbi:hypothetical protein [Streptomyces sp. NK08204]|uniref:hypothetical protein n=1 Tax=Streptomyces sp. NK08204 TaxID=2873260 RepID=UPI001CEC0E91|nr:hypothetical protein [Streptomyces sp. NK08204]